MGISFNRGVIVLIALFCSIVSKSESGKSSYTAGLPYNIPTPTASNLGQYGLVPISEYTGKGEVCVPIHRMEARGVEMDVSLYYDTSGLLVHQLPGWTGHGWTLMAGGTITRKVNGFPDEFNFQLPSLGSISYYKNYFQVHKTLENRLLDTRNVESLEKYCDPCADVFFFTFMGKSGRFWLGTDGEWKVLSDDNLSVEFDVDDDSNYIETVFNIVPYTHEKQPQVIKGFTIIDDNGVRYNFGGDCSSIELSTDLKTTYFANKNMFWIASTWMLTSVVDRFGKVLYSLHYKRGKFITQVCRAYFSETQNASNGSTDGFDSSTSALAATLNSPVYLYRIFSSSGQMVKFESQSPFDGEIASHVLYPSFYDADGKLKIINDLQENAAAMYEKAFLLSSNPSGYN